MFAEYNKQEEESFKDKLSVYLIEFTEWLQDNYSQNSKQGSKEMLQPGFMRKDFTNDVYSMSEIVSEFIANHQFEEDNN